VHQHSNLRGTGDREVRLGIVNYYICHLSVSKLIVLGNFGSSQNSSLGQLLDVLYLYEVSHTL